MKQTGINMETVKKQNRASIFNFMNERGPISKKDIAAELGLTAPAVTQICARFIEAGILLEKGTLTEGVRAGRKKVLIDINYDYAYVFGINIEREKTIIALTNLRGEIKIIREMPTNRRQEPELFLQQVALQCKEIQEEVSILDDQMAGAGVGISGVIEQDAVSRSMCCGIWKEKVAVGKLMESFLNMPVKLENNITAFALAECMYGAAKKCGTMLFLRWDSRLESVVIVNRNSVKNRAGVLAGVEHMVVDKFGEECCCGRKGCLETKVSFAAISQEIEQHFSYEATPKLYELVGGDLRNLTFELFVTNQMDMDEIIIKLFWNKIDLLAQTLVNAIGLLAPDGVVLCGSLFANPDNRRKLTQACILYDAKFQESQLIYTKLEDKQSYIGPVALSVNAYLDNLTL